MPLIHQAKLRPSTQVQQSSASSISYDINTTIFKSIWDCAIMWNMITRMNSDNLAKAAALALVVIKLVLSWDEMSGAH